MSACVIYRTSKAILNIINILIKTPEFLGVISTGANSKNKPITTTNRSIILRKLFKNISGPNPISLKTIYITITTIITVL